MTNIDYVHVPVELASTLAAIDVTMDRNSWASHHVEQARDTLGHAGSELVRQVARQLEQHGWVITVLPVGFSDEHLRRSAAGVLAAVGVPFFSIDGGRGLWLDGLSAPEREPGSFGGFAAQALHIDAPNVTAPPDYTSLLMLRPDPVGGGVSVLADLRAAAANLDEGDQRVLRKPVFFEGRAENLQGVGDPLLPFPVLDDLRDGLGWIRWAGKLLVDERNRSHWPVLTRFAALLDATVQRVLLVRGHLLIVDQRRVAHGRDPLGPQTDVSPQARRLLSQAKVRRDPMAPVQQALLSDRSST